MKTAVVICPGRGTYNKTELGYLTHHHADKRELLAGFDAVRTANGQETVTDLDGAASYSATRHTRGDNASALIYACTYADFLAIDRSAIKVVAVTGNSMGWYSALACAGALSPRDGFTLANTMGTLMQQRLIGGQLIYPFADETWRMDLNRRAELLALIQSIDAEPGHDVALSIDLGGMLVIAGNDAGLKAFERAVPRVQERFPLRLANHAAFHTALQAPVAAAGREKLPRTPFVQPSLPLIDGRGAIWWPGAVDAAALYDYTLGHQVTATYDFTQAITTAAREFAPDLFIITGPGTTLGGAVAQSLIRAQWKNMASRADFETTQKASPVIAAMGMADQRATISA
ncbi:MULTISPECIES: ACP S-malonyltransferase [unclassified Beijerinckia]|uniref:ACP S-malonyltransferase n=1 Tax=unclassified Beijerinckia TaxID=2638183 RepID=UPI00089CE498|nr:MULTISPECIES: ACP S-malonyltransferase [unclassified Beijerinckia]MDH7798414.1 [acyl-carrier-protein] S-malonyltransferase [Beijerinckia sp. GAS462]SED20059.1 Malonyl CoA-acyl carrier protein transacylase [Beijerinckia sp. 28-YEA-48]